MSKRALTTLKRVLPAALIVAAVCVGAVLLFHRGTRAYQPPPIAFDGPSEDLKQTVIVPTLDTPIPENKNVIWCASFQIAWNEMRDEIVKEPIRIQNAEEIAQRLNNAKTTKDDLVPGSYYAKVGAVADGIIEQIQQEMANRFPDVPTPEIEASAEAFVAYAYLAANVKFTIPFFENTEEFLFGKTPVSSFGIREKDTDAYNTLRSQVQILYRSADDDDYQSWYEREFVIDPCKDSSPNQLILARVKPKQTLAETLADMEAKIAGWNGTHDEHEFESVDVLLVPNVFYRINHHFTGLEGTDKIILNEGCPIPGYWVRETSQMTDFKLDRSGAELKTEAVIVCENGARYFVFNRPFLIIMKKRGADRPFFVMWVDNAELLCKPE